MDNSNKPKHESNLLSWAAILPVITAFFYYIGKTYDDGYYITLGIDITMLSFPFEHYLTTNGIMILVFFSSILLINYNYRTEVSKLWGRLFWGYFLRNFISLLPILIIIFYTLFWGRTSFYLPLQPLPSILFLICFFIAIIIASIFACFNKNILPKGIFSRKSLNYFLVLIVSISFIYLSFRKGIAKANNFTNNQEAFYTIINFEFNDKLYDSHKTYIYILYNNNRYFVYDSMPNPQNLFIFHENLIKSIKIEKRPPQNTN